MVGLHEQLVASPLLRCGGRGAHAIPVCPPSPPRRFNWFDFEEAKARVYAEMVQWRDELPGGVSASKS